MSIRSPVVGVGSTADRRGKPRLSGKCRLSPKLGISMLLSSGSKGWFLVVGTVAKESPDHVEATPGEGDQCLFVGLAFSTLAVVEGARGWTVLKTGECGEVTGAQQSSVEPAWPVQVAADAA